MKNLPAVKAVFAAVIFALVYLSAPETILYSSVSDDTGNDVGPKAQPITSECSFIISDDASYIDISSGSGQEIGSIYIQWNDPPAKRAVLTSFPHSVKEPPEPGGYGFINDFIPLSDPASRVRVTWDKQEEGVSVAGIKVFTPGDPPSDIQRWEPPLEKADMLLISTHADDEHLYFGGAMPVYAGEHCKKVQVAYFVNHGILRTRELLGGLWEVGITNYPLISDFPDQYVASYETAEKFYGLDKSLEFQVMLLRRFKPEVVLGHDLDGEYGHGAHMLNARTLTMALELASDADEYPGSAAEYGVWDVKKCYLHLYDENEIVMDWTLPLEYFGGRSGWEMAKAGYEHHVSQHKFKFLVRIEGPNDCRKFGLYRSTVGPDILKNDFFENIPVSVITEPAATATPAASPSAAPSSISAISVSGSETDGGFIGRFRMLDNASKIIVYAALAVIFVTLSLAAVWNRSSHRTKRKKRRVRRKP